MWVSVFETLIKGGFGVIVLRTLVSGIRQSFLSRSKEVQIAKILRSEIATTEQRVLDFEGIINVMVSKNMSVSNGQFQCDASPLPPVDGSYRQNYSEIYSMLQKYDPSAIEQIAKFFVVAHNYEVLLASYRQLYLGSSAVNHRTDPNRKYSMLVNSMGLAGIGEHSRTIFEALDKVIEGSWGWRLLKRKSLYRIFSVFAMVLLIFIPEREDL